MRDALCGLAANGNRLYGGDPSMHLPRAKEVRATANVARLPRPTHLYSLLPGGAHTRLMDEVSGEHWVSLSVCVYLFVLVLLDQLEWVRMRSREPRTIAVRASRAVLIGRWSSLFECVWFCMMFYDVLCVMYNNNMNDMLSQV